jgi:hypothetical protein
MDYLRDRRLADMKINLRLCATTALLSLAATAQAASPSIGSTSLTDGKPIPLTFIGAEANCGSGQAPAQFPKAQGRTLSSRHPAPSCD